MDRTPESFRQIVEAHQRMVFSLALRVTGDYGGAEEIAQDVFLELYRTLHKLEGEDHLRFWLRRVSVHRATDWLRRSRRQPESAAEAWIDEHHSPLERPATATSMEAEVRQLLGTLPEAMRVAVVLRYQEEMPPQEIAELLRQPVATVKSNLRRGLGLLRRKAETTLKEYVR